MAVPLRIPLRDLQPSQLYVSERKLRAVLSAWTDRGVASLEPVPVKWYGERLVTTDGHTRALAAHRQGLEAIYVVEDEDVLDDEAYRVCVGWCVEEGIRSVVDLEDRVVDQATYEHFWLDRCARIHRDLDTDSV